MVGSMTYPTMPNECIRSTERLFVIADLASYFVFVSVVDGIFMTCQVIGPGEHGITGFPCGWVRSHASMRPWLSVSRCDGCCG